MKKRSCKPFYGKREQRTEKAIHDLAQVAARSTDPELGKQLNERITKGREAVQLSMAVKAQQSAGRSHASWTPMPRKGFHVELGVEVANGQS